MATLRQWQYFVAVLDEGTFTDAALRLGVSQPGLSHQLKALEASLGGTLLERMSSGIRLTPVGRAVEAHARAALADSRRAEQAACSALGLEEGALEVATITSLSLGVFPNLVRRWRTDCGVSIVLHEYRTMDALIAAMHSGLGDVALAPTPTEWAGPRFSIGEEELVVLVDVAHRLARQGRSRVELKELADENWVQFSESHGLASVLDHLARQAGFIPKVAMRTEQTAAAPLFAAAGVGPVLVPRNIIGPGTGGHVLRLDPPIMREISAFCRATPDSVTRSFIEVAIDHAQLQDTTFVPSTDRSDTRKHNSP